MSSDLTNSAHNRRDSETHNLGNSQTHSFTNSEPDALRQAEQGREGVQYEGFIVDTAAAMIEGIANAEGNMQVNPQPECR